MEMIFSADEIRFGANSTNRGYIIMVVSSDEYIIHMQTSYMENGDVWLTFCQSP